MGHKHTAVWFVQFIRQEIRLIDYYIDNEGVGIPEYAIMLQEKKYNYGKHYAPWDVSAEHNGPNSRSMQTGKDLVEIARDAGIDFTIVEKRSIDAGIKTAQEILVRCWFDVDKCDTGENSENGVKCLEMYQAKWNENTGTYDKKPLQNWAAHGADAFRYLAIVYRYSSVQGERVGESKQTMPKRAGHSAYGRNKPGRGLKQIA